MSNVFVDYSALASHAFGRRLIRELREMARQCGTTEDDLLEHLRDGLAAENEWRAERGIEVVAIRGIAML